MQKPYAYTDDIKDSNFQVTMNTILHKDIYYNVCVLFQTILNYTKTSIVLRIHLDYQ